jgi:hypothetical protein
VRDFLYLVQQQISTSVKGETGNGGNITINADQFIQSSDSTVEATLQLGVSGTVTINGLVDANSALTVLSTQLRGRIEILREACV